MARSDATRERPVDGYRGGVANQRNGTAGGSGAGGRLARGLTVAVVCAMGVYAVATVFLTRPGGQRVDETALQGARLGRSHLIDEALAVLGLVSVAGLALATAVIAVLAFTRRRVDLAIGAVLLVVGANVTTQLVKYRVLERPDLGIDTRAFNSLPSGHTTVAASLAVALVLVVPVRLRAVTGLLGAAATTIIGVLTLAAGWHRPSDVVAALLVVGAWGGLVAVGSALAAPYARRTRWSGMDMATGAVLVFGGVALLSAAAFALSRTAALDGIATDRSDLFVAYAGGAAGIGGTTALLFAAALVLAADSAGSRSRSTTTSDSSVSANVPGVYADGTSTRTHATRPGA